MFSYVQFASTSDGMTQVTSLGIRPMNTYAYMCIPFKMAGVIVIKNNFLKIVNILTNFNSNKKNLELICTKF